MCARLRTDCRQQGHGQLDRPGSRDRRPRGAAGDLERKRARDDPARAPVPRRFVRPRRERGPWARSSTMLWRAVRPCAQPGDPAACRAPRCRRRSSGSWSRERASSSSRRPTRRTGFALAGVRQLNASRRRTAGGPARTVARSGDGRRHRRRAAGQPGGCASRSGSWRRRWPGLVVVLPAPLRGRSVAEEDYVLQLIRRAIGYQVRLS